MSDVRFTLAFNLRALRRHLGLRQYEVAKLLGITQQTYCGYELGSTGLSAEMLCKLSDIYDVSSDVLLRQLYPFKSE